MVVTFIAARARLMDREVDSTAVLRSKFDSEPPRQLGALRGSDLWRKDH
jgi:hypothetical protein